LYWLREYKIFLATKIVDNLLVLDYFMKLVKLLGDILLIISC